MRGNRELRSYRPPSRAHPRLAAGVCALTVAATLAWVAPAVSAAVVPRVGPAGAGEPDEPVVDRAEPEPDQRLELQSARRRVVRVLDVLHGGRVGRGTAKASTPSARPGTAARGRSSRARTSPDRPMTICRVCRARRVASVSRWATSRTCRRTRLSWRSSTAGRGRSSRARTSRAQPTATCTASRAAPRASARRSAPTST